MFGLCILTTLRVKEGRRIQLRYEQWCSPLTHFHKLQQVKKKKPAVLYLESSQPRWVILGPFHSLASHGEVIPLVRHLHHCSCIGNMALGQPPGRAHSPSQNHKETRTGAELETSQHPGTDSPGSWGQLIIRVRQWELAHLPRFACRCQFRVEMEERHAISPNLSLIIELQFYRIWIWI